MPGARRAAAAAAGKASYKETSGSDDDADASSHDSTDGDEDTDRRQPMKSGVRATAPFGKKASQKRNQNSSVDDDETDEGAVESNNAPATAGSNRQRKTPQSAKTAKNYRETSPSSNDDDEDYDVQNDAKTRRRKPASNVGRPKTKLPTEGVTLLKEKTKGRAAGGRTKKKPPPDSEDLSDSDSPVVVEPKKRPSRLDASNSKTPNAASKKKNGVSDLLGANDLFDSEGEDTDEAVDCKRSKADEVNAGKKADPLKVYKCNGFDSNLKLKISLRRLDEASPVRGVEGQISGRDRPVPRAAAAAVSNGKARANAAENGRKEEVLVESLDEEEEDEEERKTRMEKGAKKKSKPIAKPILSEEEEEEEEEEDDEEEEEDADGDSEEDSDDIGGGMVKRRKMRKRKRAESENSFKLSESEEEGGLSVKKKRVSRQSKKVAEVLGKEKKRGKRNRIRERKTSSCEEDKISMDEEEEEKLNRAEEEEEEEEDGEEGKGGKGKKGKGKLKRDTRKKMRKIIKDSKLKAETIDAVKAEEERRQRVADKQKLYNNVVTEEDKESPTKCPKVTSLVLDRDPETKEPLVSVDPYICQHLKPHQVEGVQFMYDCLVESVDRVEKEDKGGGAILAHCMGLGKTLQVVTLTHTLLHHERLGFEKALVLCPLNVCLNWVDEFLKWTPSDSVDVYEMSQIKDNRKRADYLEQWFKEGGVLILGYDMFRNLAGGTRFSKKLRTIYEKCLKDPGPDFIICDEGHLLKNENTATSKVVSQVKTRRRVALTGTPLQNNLIEYHCMVNFVKPNLLGTVKEYKNRFVNPIMNGSCADSRSFDVKLMKQRAHILHELLDGCVQRRDYTALTKFLLPKHEYVVKVRLSPLQIKLYQEYLDRFVFGTEQVPGAKFQRSGGRLFQDFQYLSRIWTHPRVLGIAQRRQDIANQYKWDDEEEEGGSDLEGFLDDEEEEEMSETSSSESEADSESGDDSESGSGAGAGGGGKEKKKSKKHKKKKKKKKKKSKSSRQREEDDDDALRETTETTTPTTSTTPAPNVTRRRRRRACAQQRGSDGEFNDASRPPSSEPEPEPQESKEDLYWYSEMLKEATAGLEDQELLNPKFSGKLSMLITIMRESETVGDKVLVFSQSLSSLDMIEEYLAYEDRLAQEGKLDETCSSAIWGWTKGEDYFRMDGSTNSEHRMRQISLFNDMENMQARLFLISTKAGSLGVNLVAANRVVIFDASWNPSHDVQSIFRVYRFGQPKPVYIYRLIAQGTMEEKIYDRQVTKQSLAHRVVDEYQIERHFSHNDLRELYNFTPDKLDDPNRKEPPIPILPKDRLLADMMKSMEDWIYHYHEHDSLLENKPEEDLTEEDRKAAWEEFEREKRTGFRTPMTNQFRQWEPSQGAAGAAAGGSWGGLGGMQNPYAAYAAAAAQANASAAYAAAAAGAGAGPNIQLNPQILQYMSFISRLQPNQRIQAQIMLMKMIFQHNPHLGKGDEAMVWQRMQQALRVHEAQLAAETLQKQQQQQYVMEQMRLRQMENARIAKEAKDREKVYNQTLYNMLRPDYQEGGEGASSSSANAPAGTTATSSSLPGQEKEWDNVRSFIIREINRNDQNAGTLLRFVYQYYPPKGKIRFGEEEMKKFFEMQHKPDLKKKVKHLLLKVIQDYHPDKVEEAHGEKWKIISEEISKRVTKYYEQLKT